MRRIVIGVLTGAMIVAPLAAEAHGGRGGGGGGGGGGGHFAAAHPTAHAPTFSNHTAEFHGAGAGSFAHGPENFSHGATNFGHGPENFAHAGPANFGHAGFENHGNWNNFNHNGAFYHNAAMGYRPNYYGSWYHGSWGGHYGYPWGYHPGGWGWGWGLGGFGLGLAAGGMMGLASSPYGWGYYNYYNPYYYGGAGVPAYANYSQPLMGAPAYASQPVDPNAYGADPNGGFGPPQTPQDPALVAFDSARSAFQQGDYQGALAQVNQALSQSPNDSVMQEFRATCLFAMQDYQQSAAAMYAVLSSGPGWDWTTMSGLYGNNDVYTAQLRALEAYRTQNPNAAYAHFLLAYQYMMLGYKEQAAVELNAVVQLQPKDQLAAQLLRGLTAPANTSAVAGMPAATNPPGQPASPQQLATAGPPIDPSALTGDWQASRTDGSAFGLKLATDNSFTWQFTQQGKPPQTLKGTYTVANDYLILKASDQNTLLGQVAMIDPNHFTFKLAGDNPGDPGLTFAR